MFLDNKWSIGGSENEPLLFAHEVQLQSSLKCLSVLLTNGMKWSKDHSWDIEFPLICLNIAVDRPKKELKCKTVGYSVCFLETAGAKVRMSRAGPSVSPVHA